MRRGLVGRVAGWAGVGVLLLTGVIVAQGWRAFGTAARGERLARMQKSLQWQGDAFENPQPLVNDGWLMLKGLFDASPAVSPTSPVSVAKVDLTLFETPAATGLRVTWLGHSTTLVEIDGQRVLTDPIWSERASPIAWAGPKRWYPPPIALKDLPPIDVVIISHDHYDHLDYGTMVAMKDMNVAFVVPLGVGAHLEYWGVPAAKITELDWWESTKVRDLEITATPSRHASGRVLFDMNAKLWAGYALVGAKHRVYYSGDTGLFPAMKEIGSRLGPFDLTMIEVGQYHRAWPDWHIGPEQAVEAHQWTHGKVFLPVHWGLFTLAYHGWTEPIERVLAAATVGHATVFSPQPGQSVEPEVALPTERWWPQVPWETAQQHPIVSGHVR
ncbi:MAG: MBL fold metallo-hydrolase [Myxococcaceae bacterium]|nr:MBL fold metallo-hydrolase [Myxococcaceae bacterium]